VQRAARLAGGSQDVGKAHGRIGVGNDIEQHHQLAEGARLPLVRDLGLISGIAISSVLDPQA
jgi:hypothetical protein